MENTSFNLETVMAAFKLLAEKIWKDSATNTRFGGGTTFDEYWATAFSDLGNGQNKESKSSEPLYLRLAKKAVSDLNQNADVKDGISRVALSLVYLEDEHISWTEIDGNGEAYDTWLAGVTFEFSAEKGEAEVSLFWDSPYGESDSYLSDIEREEPSKAEYLFDALSGLIEGVRAKRSE